jgi:transposase
MAATTSHSRTKPRRRRSHSATPDRAERRSLLLDELQAQFDDLRTRHERRTKEFEELQCQYAELQKTSAQQAERIRELEEKLAKAQKNSRNSSKPPSSDIVKPKKPVDSSTAAGDAAAQGKRKRGAQPGHPRHQRPEFTPDQIDHILSHGLTACPCCGSADLTTRDETHRVFHQIEIPVKPLETTEHQLPLQWCAHCEKLITAAWPPGLLEAGLFGPRLSALVGFMKGACGMTLSSMRRTFRDVFLVKVSKGFLAKVVNKVSGSLADPYEELLRLLPDEDLLNVDETGHKDSGQRMWTWCFRALTFTVFKISPSRGSQVLLEVLGTEFDGLLGCDYFSAYRKYMRLNEKVRVQFCLAHFIRDVKYLVGHPDAANQAYGERLREHLRELFGIIHRRAQYATEAEFLAALSDARDKLVWATTMDSPHTREAQALEERFYKHTESYFRFITDPDIEPTNNLAEQAIRFVALQRKITQGTRGETGQLWCERIWTVVATCDLQGRSAFDYLVKAIVAHFTHQPTPTLVNDSS